MTEQKMTMQQMLPNFEELFKAKAIKRIIVYVDADMDAIPHLTESTPDGVSHLSEARMFEVGSVDESDLTKVRSDLTEVIGQLMPSQITMLLKSPLNNGTLGVFVKSPEGYDPKNDNSIQSYLDMKPDYVWDHLIKNKPRKMTVKFFINDADEARVEVTTDPASDNSREDFISTAMSAIPELADDSQCVTHVGFKCVTTDEYEVRYGFNHAKGNHLPEDDDVESYTDFGVNFVAPNSDGSEFASDSKFFIKPEDWETLMTKSDE